MVAWGMALVLGAEAGTITWREVENWASAADVVTEGSLVQAVNACGSSEVSDLEVAGVRFAPAADLLEGDATADFLAGDSGHEDYNRLLNTLDYGAPGEIELAEGRLTPGRRYLVQVWYVDERGNYNHRGMQYGDGHGNRSGEVNDQHVSGTFIATADSQTLTIVGVGTGTPHLTAYQVRDLGDPAEGVIAWNSPVDYATGTDVRLDGLLVEAVNATGAEGAASPVVNGVRFAADPSLLGDDATTDFLHHDTGDAAYNQLLNSLDFGAVGSLQIGGGKLELGKKYLLQAWYVDERSNSDGRSMQFGDGFGNLSDPVNDQFVTGTFIGAGGVQNLTIHGVGGGPHFTAYQLRDLSSPLPTLISDVGQVVNGSFVVMLNFTEHVTGLDSGDFATVNATVSDLVGEGMSWSLVVTPEENGDLAIHLPANLVIDGDQHGNAASNVLQTTFVADGSDQAVVALSTEMSEVRGDYAVTVEFSEAITGLEVEDFEVSGGSVIGLLGSGSSYQVVIRPELGGDVAVHLPRNSVVDTDGDRLGNLRSNLLVNPYYREVEVSSLVELLPYLEQDNITATIAPGSYTINADDVREVFGTPRFEFRGSNSRYDFTGVTIYFSEDIYEEGLSMNHLQVFGNDNVLMNLSMVDQCDKYGDPGKEGGVNVTLDGRNNRVEGFHLTVRGSYPYGYGDCFGKGGSYTIKHWKHSGLLVRGSDNHVLNCTLDQKSYGHCIFMQAAENPTIEGCYVEAEVRSTDDMLAEEGSGSAADLI
ncbi:MAG: Ig-like domain-containing protein, partial [Verrucomicrobiales bacterium]